MYQHAGADWDASLAQLFQQMQETTAHVTYAQMLRNVSDATAPSFNLEVDWSARQLAQVLACRPA